MWVRFYTDWRIVRAKEKDLRACPLCRIETSSSHLAAQAWNNCDGVELRKCAGCGFVFSAEAGFSYESFVADSVAGQSVEELMRMAQSQGLGKLVGEIAGKAGIGRGARVLDFGSGIGLAALSFMDAGFDVLAVEASTEYVEQHKSLGIRSFRSVAQAAKQGLFDLVVIKDVLEHIEDPCGILSVLASCISSGGHLYVRVPNVIAYRFHWSVDTKSHINHFTPAILVRLCEKYGMRKADFVGVYDISSQAGKIYNAVVWPARKMLPLYHQISILFEKI